MGAVQVWVQYAAGFVQVGALLAAGAKPNLTVLPPNSSGTASKTTGAGGKPISAPNSTTLRALQVGPCAAAVQGCMHGTRQWAWH